MTNWSKLAAVPIVGCVALIGLLLAWPQAARRVGGAECQGGGSCIAWDPNLALVNMAADSVIAASYAAIAIALFVLAKRTRDGVGSHRMFVVFGAFVMAGGIAHAVAVVWDPLYWLRADLKFVSAVVALGCAVALPAALPSIERLVTAAGHRSREESWFTLAATNSTDAYVVLLPVRSEAGEVEDFSVQFANPSAVRMFGGSIAGCGRVLSAPLLAPWLPKLEGLTDVIDGGTPFRAVFEGRTQCGEARWLEQHIIKLGNDGLFVIARDVTSHRRADERSVRNGLRDPLTGLHNRVQLAERIEAAMAMTRRSGGVVGVVFIDIDDFKCINDTHGHNVGDQILIAVAERLSAAVRETDVVFRYGGDELVILVPGLLFDGDLAIFGDRLMRSLEAPIAVANAKFHITLSVGGAVFPDDAQEPSELLRCADEAMYRSKAKGRNAFTLYGAGETSTAARDSAVAVALPEPARLRSGGRREPADKGREDARSTPESASDNSRQNI